MINEEDLILTEEDLKARIDVLAFFIHFFIELTGQEPQDLSNFSAPYRKDNKPSFGLYEHRTTQEIMFKDRSLGKSGDIFEFVKLLYNLTTRKEAFKVLLEIYKSGKIEKPTSFEYYKNVLKEKTTLYVKSKPFTKEGLAYWQQYYISPEILTLYNCTQVDALKMIKGEQIKYFQPEFSFAYRIVDCYQIYQPYDREHKFFNSLKEHYIMGYYQLPAKGKLLIIDKSMKDVMFCYYLGLPAIAPKAEGIMIPPEYFKILSKRFRRIVVMLDNDTAGILNAEKYPEEFEKIYLVSAKDKTDLVLSVGLKKAKKEIFSLLKLK